MADFHTFAALHVPGDPLILFNVWDAGSARVAAQAGAKAIATGSASVASAHGVGDGEQLPIGDALANARRIVAAAGLPVTVDFEGGYADSPEAVGANVARLAETGAIGCNIEDQVVGGEGLRAIDVQAGRLAAARAAAGADFFINARTDIFLKAPRDTHDAAQADAAIARARAYAEAGASGFFVPGLVDPALIARICRASPLPVNVMAMPGAPAAAEIARAGAARISHGPFPYRLAMDAFEQAARAAFGG